MDKKLNLDSLSKFTLFTFPFKPIIILADIFFFFCNISIQDPKRNLGKFSKFLDLNFPRSEVGHYNDPQDTKEYFYLIFFIKFSNNLM